MLCEGGADAEIGDPWESLPDYYLLNMYHALRLPVVGMPTTIRVIRSIRGSQEKPAIAGLSSSPAMP